MISSEGEDALKRRMIWFLAVIAGLLGLAAAWNWSPMREWLNIDRVVDSLQQIGQTAGPIASIAGLAAASALAVPLSIMTVVAIVAFGATAGFMYCIVGACIGGAFSYGLGRHLGRKAVERLAGPRINNISRRLAGRGMLSVIAIRLIPAAPFAIVNMLAGASHIGFRDFILGTAIGMIPGTLVIAVFIDKIIQSVREPGTSTLLIAGITIVLIVGGLWAMQRWLAGDSSDQPPGNR